MVTHKADLTLRRSDHDIAQLDPVRNNPAKFELILHYGCHGEVRPGQNTQGEGLI